jgi:hypothetical protein
MKKNWLNSYQVDALSAKDKQKYETVKYGSQLVAVILGIVVSKIVKKEGGSIGKQIGFGLGTVAVGYGIAYVATRRYSNDLGIKTGISSDANTAMNTQMRADVEKLKAEALKDYNYYGV